MTIFTGIILYLMIYWLVIFMVLPWGNRAADRVQEGNATSAPANPRIKQKFIVTAFVAAFFWCVVFGLVHFKVIDFYGIAKQMEQEDLTK